MLFVLPILLELLLLAGVIAVHLRDRQGLKKFVDVAADPERLKEYAMQLPIAYRAPATQFAGELARKGSLDELIVQAVTQAANTTYSFALWLRLVFGAILSFVVLAPFAASLIAAAQKIDESLAAVEGRSGSLAFLASRALIEPEFGHLQTASQATGWLLVGMVIIGAVHWLLNRSEVREARFVEALLEAAIAARPGSSAPVASRLSELVAPQRSLAIPIAAFVFFFVAAGAGWVLLLLTADAKEANAADIYRVWPQNSRPKIAARGGVLMPARKRGGSEIPGDTASLSIFEEGLDVAGTEVSRNKEGKFPPAQIAEHLKKFKTVSIVAHRNMPFKNVLEVLELLPGIGFDSAYLVFERRVLIKEIDGGDYILAGIPFRLRSRQVNTIFSMLIEETKVWIDPKMPAGFQIQMDEKNGWEKELNNLARKRIADKSSGSAQPEVTVRIEADVTYDKVIEILSAADSTCERETDCGVPGLGLQFYYSM